MLLLNIPKKYVCVKSQVTYTTNIVYPISLCPFVEFKLGRHKEKHGLFLFYMANKQVSTNVNCLGFLSLHATSNSSEKVKHTHGLG